MSARERSRLPVISLAIIATSLPFLPPRVASAGGLCSFDAGTGTITIDAAATSTSTIVRSGDDVLFDGAPCGGATVTTTGSVSVTTHEDSIVVIDLSGGPFAPGTSTTDDDPEIKFDVEPSNNPTEYPFTVEVFGTDGPEWIAAGQAPEDVVNLNADEPTPDVDLRVHPDEGTLDVRTMGGDDRVSLEGGAAVDDTSSVDPLADQLLLDAGSGNDRVTCGGGDGSTLAGGDGTDMIDCSSMSEFVFLYLVEEAPGIGHVVSNGGGDVTITDFEHGVGTRYDDVLSGIPGGNDRLVGGRGDDAIVGWGGADRLVGGSGRDQVLGKGGDDALSGGPGDDLLRGGPGVDLCRGGTGNDRVLGCE